jgi:hypothetical protein
VTASAVAAAVWPPHPLLKGSPSPRRGVAPAVRAGCYDAVPRWELALPRELTDMGSTMYVRAAQYSRSCGYVLTALGTEAATDVETCECVDLLVVDGCFQCRECGTVYGLVFGWAKSPRRTHWRRQA